MNTKERERKAVLSYIDGLRELIDKGAVLSLYKAFGIDISKLAKWFEYASLQFYTFVLCVKKFGDVSDINALNGQNCIGGFYVVINGVVLICKISRGNHKLGKTKNISKLAGFSCKHCKYCLKDCYVIKSYKQYPDKVRADYYNTILFKTLERFDAWDAFIEAFDKFWTRKRNREYFRIDESGDLISWGELLAWRQIALRHPETRFYSYTKVKTLFEGYEEQKRVNRLDNFVVRFSPWLGDEDNNPESIKTRRGCGYYVLDVSEEQLKEIARVAGGYVCPCVNGNTKNACERCGHKCAYRDVPIFEKLNA